MLFKFVSMLCNERSVVVTEVRRTLRRTWTLLWESMSCLSRITLLVVVIGSRWKEAVDWPQLRRPDVLAGDYAVISPPCGPVERKEVSP